MNPAKRSGKILQTFWPTYDVDPAGLRTAGDWITMRNLYANLVDQQAHDVVRPDLAQSWRRSQDGLVWDFILRDGLKWSDGSPMTVEQIAESLRHGASGTTHTHLSAFTESISVVAPNTIRFHLKSIPENFLTTLSFVDLAIVHPSARQRTFSWTMPTSGPYQFVHGSEEHYFVKANRYHWDYQDRKFDDLEIVRGTADSRDVTTLLGGKWDACHLAAGVASGPDIERLKKAYEVYTVNSDFLLALAFSKSSPVIKKLGVMGRQAFLRRLYLEFWKGQMDDPRRAVGVRPPDIRGSLARTEFDKILAEMPDDFKAVPLRLLVQTPQSNRSVVHDLIDKLKAIGVQVQLETKERDLFRKAHDDGDFDVLVQFAGTSESDPDSAWRMYNSELLEPAATQQELAEAQAERDGGRRQELYREFERRALRRALYVPLKVEASYICIGQEAELDSINATEWGLLFSHLKVR